MSTKTSIKRIALVAAAALTLGGFSAVSANAAQTVAQTYLYCSNADGGAISNLATTGATCNGVAGPSNYVTLTSVTQAKDVQISVSGTTLVAGTGTSTKWVINSAGTLATIAAGDTGASSSNNTIRVMTPTTGTITVTIAAATAGSGIFTASTETVVITVAATAASGVYSAANTTAYIVAGETSTATADATVVAPKTYASTESATASIVITYLDGNGTGSAIRDTLTATITSGGGTLAAGTVVSGTSGTAYADAVGFAWDSRSVRTFNAPTVNYSTSLRTDASGNVAFLVMANGVAGVSTIVVKNSAGTVIATKSLTFTGTDVSSITLTAVKSYVNGDTASGGTSKVLTAVLKDSTGNIVTGLAWAPTVTYSVATLGAYRSNNAADTATSDTTGTVTYGWTAPSTVAYGPVTVTFTDPTTKATASATITISSAVAASVTASAPSSVDLGNSFSYTVTAKDANGYAIPDGSVASNYISSLTSNGGIGSPDLTATSTGGVFTLKVTGPVVNIAQGSGAFLLTGTAGTANSYLAKTLTATTVTATFAVNSVGGDASLALDAANAATDAANNAYDEAQNATQAAQDALAAVTALAAQVKSLIASVKSLTALVSKIKAKVGA